MHIRGLYDLQLDDRLLCLHRSCPKDLAQDED